MGVGKSLGLSLFLVLFAITFQNCSVSGEGTTHLGSNSSRGTPNPTPSPTPGPTPTPTPTPSVLDPNDFSIIRQGGLVRGSTVSCPGGTKVSGCTGLCGTAYYAGGAYPTGNGCLGSCDSAGDTVTLSTMCAREIAGRTVTIQSNSSATNGNHVSCPNGTKLIGCAAACANGRAGGASAINNNTGCQLSCTSNEVGGVLSAFCLNEPSRTVTYHTQTVSNGGSVTCPAGTYLAGAAGFCAGPTPGGLTTSGNSVAATCPSGSNANVTAVCIQ